MTTTHHVDRTAAPKLKKFAARAALAGGLGMAATGLTAAMATADPAPPNTPGPTPTITATLRPPAPRGESGLCNRDTIPRDQPPPLNC